MVGPALENLALIQQRERHLRTLKQSYNKLEYLNQAHDQQSSKTTGRNTAKYQIATQ